MAVMPVIPTPLAASPSLEPTHFSSQTTATAQWVGFSLGSAFAPWFHQSLDTIRRYVGLETNWDGYGSPPIAPAVIEASVGLLSRFGLSGDDLPAPRIVPVSGGALQIEFEVRDKILEVEILPDRSIELLVKQGLEENEAHLTGPLFNVEGIARWLSAP